MEGSIKDYARLGLVHHMLYPESMFDPEEHERTLTHFSGRQDIETFDCCLPYGKERREVLVEKIVNSGKEDICFATHLFPRDKISFLDTRYYVQEQIKMVVEDMIQQAGAIGASGFIFTSGGPSPEQAGKEEIAAFDGYMEWLCRRLADYDMEALLEPADYDVDKCQYYGTTSSCVELIERVNPEKSNFGINLDYAHIPLMHENIGEATRKAAPFLRRVHLGNCVLKDRKHRFYGDTHPPIGIEGGEFNIPELVIIFRELLAIGFLDKESRGSLLIEMVPWPGKTVDETVKDNFSRLDEAWRLV